MKCTIVVTFDEQGNNPQVVACEQDAQVALDVYENIRDNALADSVAYVRNVRFDKRARGLKPAEVVRKPLVNIEEAIEVFEVPPEVEQEPEKEPKKGKSK